MQYPSLPAAVQAAQRREAVAAGGGRVRNLAAMLASRESDSSGCGHFNASQVGDPASARALAAPPPPAALLAGAADRGLSVPGTPRRQPACIALRRV